MFSSDTYPGFFELYPFCFQLLGGLTYSTRSLQTQRQLQGTPEMGLLPSSATFAMATYEPQTHVTPCREPPQRCGLRGCPRPTQACQDTALHPRARQTPVEKLVVLTDSTGKRHSLPKCHFSFSAFEDPNMIALLVLGHPMKGELLPSTPILFTA